MITDNMDDGKQNSTLWSTSRVRPTNAGLTKANLWLPTQNQPKSECRHLNNLSPISNFPIGITLTAIEAQTHIFFGLIEAHVHKQPISAVSALVGNIKSNQPNQHKRTGNAHVISYKQITEFPTFQFFPLIHSFPFHYCPNLRAFMWMLCV